MIILSGYTTEGNGVCKSTKVYGSSEIELSDLTSSIEEVDARIIPHVEYAIKEGSN